MSMISSQYDERLDERLRRAAQTCRELGKHTTANMFLEAADTILELRDDLQRANEAVQDAEHDESMAWDRVRKVERENAKLREERDHWRVEQVHAYGNWEDTYKRASELEAENAKLRKLVRDMMEFFEDGDWCVKCERALDCQAQEQYEDECLMRFVFRDRMCELGIEADS